MILSARGGKTDIQVEFFVRQICDRIKKVREEKNYSQDHLGLALGISGQAYGKIEKGTTKITVMQLAQIAESLKYPLDRLLQIEPSDTIVSDLEEKVNQLQEKIRKAEKDIHDKQLFIELLQEKLQK